VLCHFAQSEQYRPASTAAVDRFRAAEELPTRYLLYIGAIEPRKNLTTLLAAWRKTYAQEQGVKLVVVGGVAPKAVYKTRNLDVAGLEDPSVYRMSYVAEEKLPLLYQGAEAFVFPSLAEGFGLTLLEAMACGTPVICSNTAAMPETAGGAARLVPPLEVEAWVEAIDSIISDSELRRHMSLAGIERASNFSWARTAEIVRTVLDSV
jgi:glycosyltransferase involved in cell wall biosynthesis